MKSPFPEVNEETSFQEISKKISKEVPAVLVKLESGGYHIITRHDVISAI
jgi:cystathionine beta-synthase